MVTDVRVSEFDDLVELGRQLRVDSIRMADAAGSGHPTSSMSAADLLAVLIGRHLAMDPARPDSRGSDKLVFSKGHATPLLYSSLHAIGALDSLDDVSDALEAYRRHGSPLEGHPTPRLPGVPVATGSLGVGLPMAVGLALAARDLDRTDARVWVLCGDSEMAEGSIWEAVEHAGWTGLSNLTLMVDVNRLGQTGPTRHGWDVGAYGDRLRAFGWETVIVDGHDVVDIDAVLLCARDSQRPTAVIARTHKGSGVPEVDDVEGKHGKTLDDPERAIEALGGTSQMRVTPRPPRDADPAATMQSRTPTALPSWNVGEEAATRDAFGATLAALGESRGEIVALDAEVGDSTRLEKFADACDDRFFQMYIAEQLMIGVAVGMQVTGWRPFAATFAAFATRAHDLLRMASISRANFCLAGSHAGVSIGADGPSQMGLEDLGMMRSLHGSTVLYPCDANQTAALIPAMVDLTGISYLRTSRPPSPVIYEAGTEFRVGGSHVLRESDRDTVTIVGAGVTVHEALAAADRLDGEGIAARVIDAYSVKPIDRAELERAAIETEQIVVAEDHRAEGGLGEAVLAALADNSIRPVVRHLAVRNMPGSASPAEQRRDAEIDAEAIVRAAKNGSRRSGDRYG